MQYISFQSWLLYLLGVIWQLPQLCPHAWIITWYRREAWLQWSSSHNNYCDFCRNTTYSRIHLIGILLIRISGSDQNFTPDKPLLWLTNSLLVCHNNGLSDVKSWSFQLTGFWLSEFNCTYLKIFCVSYPLKILSRREVRIKRNMAVSLMQSDWLSFYESD